MSQSVFVMDTPRDCLHCKMRSVIYDSDRGYQHCGFDTDGYKLESFFSERDLAEGWISPKCPLISEIDFINESEIQKDSWIPCSERLPEEVNRHYLITYREVIQGEFYYSTKIDYLSTLPDGTKSWELEEAKPYVKVTAWRKVPEPYQKEGE